MTERENGAAQPQGGAARRPLEGVRIIDFTQVLAGLADADEIALIRTSSEEQLRSAIFGN